jgi:hypothetical protein
LVFLDNVGNNTDTIRLLIPNPKLAMRINTQSLNEQEGVEKQTSAEPSNVKQEDNADKTGQDNSTKANAGNDCASLATEKDFFTIRRTMAAEETDTGMIKVATKFFEEKCFTTEQIKNLSALFLTPSGKFDFFNAAYNHTSDRGSFAALQSEIKDDYYAGRFKDLVGGR